MKVTFKSLAETLGRNTNITILEEDDGNIIVSEYGARIIGVFYSDSPNLLWVNPDLENVLKTRGWNIGGARVWISPERNFFYMKPASFEEWFCPEGLDPGNYRFIAEDQRMVSLECYFKTYDFVNKGWLTGVIRRDIGVDKGKRGILKINVRESLLTDNFTGTLVNLWALIQVPPGAGKPGTVLIPVKKGTQPVHYFGKIPEDRLRVSENHVSFRIDGLKVTKLGIRPEDLPREGEASIIYVREDGEGLWNIICMKSKHLPRSQKECLDVAKADPRGPKGAVQSYNSGPEGSQLKFGEIELHFLPATRIKEGMISTVVYTIEAFRGSFNEVFEMLVREYRIEEPFLF